MTQKTFTIPPYLGGGNVVVKELTAGEVEDILRAESTTKKTVGLADGNALMSALVRKSIVEFRGKPFPNGTEGEIEWRRLPIKLKNLLQVAYEHLNNVSDDESSDFLSSAQINQS